MLRSAADAPVGLLLSGGLDSSILLWHLLERGVRVQPIYVDAALAWQGAERQAVGRIVSQARGPLLAELVCLALPLADVYGDHWSVTGRDVPGDDTEDAAVYLPGRNPLLIIKARLWCQLHGLGQLALGCLRTNPFADATEAFFAQFAAVLDQAMSGAVELLRPLAALDKRGAMELGRRFPLQLTFSCLRPRGQRHCGNCNKCGERQEAFRLAGLADPTDYAAARAHAGAGD
jgi:7-cyano-7-deazaguanine synthase